MSALNNARQGRQNIAILAVLLTGQMFLMSGSARGSRGSVRVESWLMRISSPVVRTAEAIGGGVSGTGQSLREMLTARTRAVVLGSDVERLTAEVQRYREMEQENRRLRRLLGMREGLVPRSIAASVVTSNYNGQTRMIVIDRGQRDGVLADLPVVSWGGAVGRVVVADATHAKVRLLTDPNSGVAGVVQRSRAQGLIFGTPEGGLELRFVPRFSDVIHGDRVVTSGLAGVFPRGFGVGRVTSIRPAADGTQTIEVVPEFSYRELEEVLIVLEPPVAGLLDLPEGAVDATAAAVQPGDDGGPR